MFIAKYQYERNTFALYVWYTMYNVHIIIKSYRYNMVEKNNKN